MPKRIQRKRTKGWRMPANAVYVGRPTSYPYDVMRRLNGRDYRINSFKTGLHARYFAAAQNIANSSCMFCHQIPCVCPTPQIQS